MKRKPKQIDLINLVIQAAMKCKRYRIRQFFNSKGVLYEVTAQYLEGGWSIVSTKRFVRQKDFYKTGSLSHKTIGDIVRTRVRWNHQLVIREDPGEPAQIVNNKLFDLFVISFK